jgi:TQXA domain-containing protein/LPXTG-motif cell wall-anchored protein
MSFVRTAAHTGRALAVGLLSAVMLTAGGTTAGAAPAADVDDPSRQGGVTASLEGLKTYGQAVVREDGEELRTGAGLFEMAVEGGGTLQSYGIDVDNPTQRRARYGETDWDQTSLHDNPNAGKILWILKHSYPQVNDLQALAKSSGAGKLSPKTAAAGTQVAIWRFSDGAGTAGKADVHAVDRAAEKLADHLERKARPVAQPRASLSLGRMNVSGRAGDRLGPVTIRTDAPSVAVVPPSGSAEREVRVVGGDGRPLTEVRGGGRLYFDVPDNAGAAGASSVTVQAATKVQVGRALTGVGGHARSQAQILAGSSESTVSATATVNWSKNGAIPTVAAEKNCAGGGVRVAVANTGDRPVRFRLAGEEYGLGVGRSRTITVPVEEDQTYRIPVAVTGGVKKVFSGVLDCATKSAMPAQGTEGIKPQSHTATVGGEDGVGEVDDAGDLAETGADNTPLILGIAVALVVLGGVAVLAVRRRKPDDGEE